jgi:hypothetical protein
MPHAYFFSCFAVLQQLLIVMVMGFGGCSNEQIEAIATRLPVDKVELQWFFPKCVDCCLFCHGFFSIVLGLCK